MNVLQLVKKHFLLKQRVVRLKKNLENGKENNETQIINTLESEYTKLVVELADLETTEIFFNEDLQAMLESTEQLQNTIKCIQGFIDNTKKIER